MPRFAANLTMMYQEHKFLDRFAAAARDGFTAVEYLFPYEHPAATLAALLKEHGLRQVLFNSPPGDWKAGERGITALPGREKEFRDGFLQALEYALVLQCPRIHSMAGIARAGTWIARTCSASTPQISPGRRIRRGLQASNCSSSPSRSATCRAFS